MNLRCLFGHQWNGCKCKRCGETRDVEHNYIAVNGKCIEKCSICGKQCSIEHKWNGCKCEICGDEKHHWDKKKGVCVNCGKIFNYEFINPCHQDVIDCIVKFERISIIACEALLEKIKSNQGLDYKDAILLVCIINTDRYLKSKDDAKYDFLWQFTTLAHTSADIENYLNMPLKDIIEQGTHKIKELQ